MDEETAIINRNTRNEKIKNFFLENKKKSFSLAVLILIILLSYFLFNDYKSKKKIEVSDLYNSTIIDYNKNNKDETTEALVSLIKKKDPTYSPLSLYFIIDNALITDSFKINELFDIIINDISLDKELKNLIYFKKALYNADSSNEKQLLDILKPLINSESVWRVHALYLMAEFFYSKNEKEKSKEFYNKIISLDNVNQDFKIEAQKRLNRDLSE